MPISEQTKRIVLLVWSRMLKLDDGALDEPGRRIEAVDNAIQAVTCVQLFGRNVLYGPDPVVAAARRINDRDLPAALLHLAREQSDRARLLGSANLLYAEHPPVVAPSEEVAVSFAPEHLEAVAAASPPDDVETSGVRDAEWAATLVAHAESDAPVAAATWQVWHHMLAHLGVLTRPEYRGRGMGRYIAAVAAQEAFDEGLIPQWRAAAGAPGSQKIAESLGFTMAGSQTTALLQ